MNRHELAAEVASLTGQSEREVRIVIDAFTETIVRTLAGERRCTSWALARFAPTGRPEGTAL